MICNGKDDSKPLEMATLRQWSLTEAVKTASGMLPARPSLVADHGSLPGELTDLGRQTTYNLGRRLRHLYVDQLQFVRIISASRISLNRTDAKDHRRQRHDIHPSHANPQSSRVGAAGIFGPLPQERQSSGFSASDHRHAGVGGRDPVSQRPQVSKVLHARQGICQQSCQAVERLD